MTQNFTSFPSLHQADIYIYFFLIVAIGKINVETERNYREARSIGDQLRTCHCFFFFLNSEQPSLSAKIARKQFPFHP